MNLTAGTASASCTRLGERTVEPPIAIAKCSKLCASTQMTINPDTKPSSPSSSISSILQPRPRTAIGLSALDHRGRPLIGHHKPSPNHWPKTLTLRAGPHATELLRFGATLSEIGQLLLHRSHGATRIYAKVDIDTLRTLSLPWPGGVQ